MCTVTYIPTNKGFYLTSSRDEKASRWTIPPLVYSNGEKKLLYPKDEIAGGTWISGSMDGRVACLLNGAFVNHKKLPNYSRSRGLILLDSFNYPSANNFSEKIDLTNVEPFTLLTLDFSTGILTQFYEFRWDGKTKHLKQLSTKDFQIWSSVTLYDSIVQETRNELFHNWIKKHNEEEDKSILNFHNRKHGLHHADDILMKGNGDLKTLSISQFHMNDTQVDFCYYDLIKDLNYKSKLVG